MTTADFSKSDASSAINLPNHSKSSTSPEAQTSGIG